MGGIGVSVCARAELEDGENLAKVGSWRRRAVEDEVVGENVGVLESVAEKGVFGEDRRCVDGGEEGNEGRVGEERVGPGSGGKKVSERGGRYSVAFEGADGGIVVGHGVGEDVVVMVFLVLRLGRGCGTLDVSAFLVGWPARHGVGPFT